MITGYKTRFTSHNGPKINAKVLVYSKLSQSFPLNSKYDKKICNGRIELQCSNVEILIFKNTLAFFNFFSIQLALVIT